MHLMVAGNPSKGKKGKKGHKKNYWRPGKNPSKSSGGFGSSGNIVTRVALPIAGGAIAGLFLPRLIPQTATGILRYGAPVAAGLLTATVGKAIVGRNAAMLAGAAMIAVAGIFAFNEFVLVRNGKTPLIGEEAPAGSGTITVINDAPEVNVIEEGPDKLPGMGDDSESPFDNVSDEMPPLQS